MAATEDFYVTLTSNASEEFFPSNSLTEFWNKCPQPISLDENTGWSVALVDFQCPVNWIPLKGGDFELRFTRTSGGYASHVMTIPPSAFKDKKALWNVLDKQIQALEDPYICNGFRMTCDFPSYKFVLFLEKESYLEASPQLLSILGIKHNAGQKIEGGRVRLGSPNSTRTFEGYLDVMGGYRTLWLYSNVCGYRFVGQASYPLLRCVAVRSYAQQILQKSFYHPMYLPVSKNYFEHLHFVIRDTQGLPVPFQSGQVVATLHFRPLKG